MTRKRFPTFQETFFDVAKVMSRQATCPRKSVGCVIVDSYQNIVSSGYNSAPAGMPTCLGSGCIDEGGHCVRVVHAEIQAISAAARRGASLKGCTAYCTLLPCIQCAQALVTAGVLFIYYDEAYVREEANTLRDLANHLGVRLIERKR